MELNAILAKLPYRAPFLFVDELIHVDEDLDFYRGQFYDRAITPGVILIETMAQIGLACLGIFLLNKDLMQGSSIALTSTEIQFLKPVYPKEKVTVFSKKIYFRFGKLKCAVTMKNEAGQEVCKGILAGMMTEEL